MACAGGRRRVFLRRRCRCGPTARRGRTRRHGEGACDSPTSGGATDALGRAVRTKRSPTTRVTSTPSPEWSTTSGALGGWAQPAAHTGSSSTTVDRRFVNGAGDCFAAGPPSLGAGLEGLQAHPAAQCSRSARGRRVHAERVRPVAAAPCGCWGCDVGKVEGGLRGREIPGAQCLRKTRPHLSTKESSHPAREVPDALEDGASPLAGIGTSRLSGRAGRQHRTDRRV